VTVYSGMPGMLFFGFVATLMILRLMRPAGGGLASGIVLIAFGVVLLWSTVTHEHYGFDVYGPPNIFVLGFGLWLVVKGALRASSY
jgi:hypothetical protein